MQHMLLMCFISCLLPQFIYSSQNPHIGIFLLSCKHIWMFATSTAHLCFQTIMCIIAACHLQVWKFKFNMHHPVWQECPEGAALGNIIKLFFCYTHTRSLGAKTETGSIQVNVQEKIIDFFYCIRFFFCCKMKLLVSFLSYSSKAQGFALSF